MLLQSGLIANVKLHFLEIKVKGQGPKSGKMCSLFLPMKSLFMNPNTCIVFFSVLRCCSGADSCVCSGSYSKTTNHCVRNQIRQKFPG